MPPKDALNSNGNVLTLVNNLYGVGSGEGAVIR